MNWTAKWIKPKVSFGDISPTFCYDFNLEKKELTSATLYITAQGVYEASLNQSPIGNFYLAPGWTAYEKRLQYQSYDIFSYIQENNHLEVTVGKGWYRSPMAWNKEHHQKASNLPTGLLAQIELTYSDNKTTTIISDATWQCKESSIRFSEIYNGEIFDATIVSKNLLPVSIYNGPSHTLIPQEGEIISTQEKIKAINSFITQKGEFILDFGQNITGILNI